MEQWFCLSLKQSLAVLGMLSSGLVFLGYALRHRESKPSIRGFLLSDRKLSGSAFADTYAVTNVSLASNIIFFIAAHQLYGWFMGIALIVYTFMQYVMLRFADSLALDFNRIHTVSDLWYQMFPSSVIARVISALTVLTCLLAVFIELYVGSVILAVFLPDAPIYKAGAFFVLGGLVVGYVYLGGYRAIIQTDKWQLYLLILAAVAMGYFTLSVPAVDPKYALEGLGHGLLAHQATGWSLFAFIAWVSMLNVCLCFMDIPVWQRMSAAISPQIASQGLLRGLWKVILIFWVPMMSFILLAAKGYEFATMPEYLNIVYQAKGILGYIIFPLIVVGFAAALFSTADTVMIAAIYGLCDHHTFLPKLEQYPPEERSMLLRKYLSIFALLFTAFLSIFYYLQSHAIAQYIMPMIEASWGLMICLAPLPIYTFYRLKRALPPLVATPASIRVLLITIMLCGVIVCIGVLQEMSNGKMAYTQLSQLIAMSVMLLGLSITVHLSSETT